METGINRQVYQSMEHLELDENAIERFRGYFNWRLLSSSQFVKWTPQLLDRYELLWDWNYLSSNSSLCWSNGLIIRHASKWDWELLTQNRSIPFSDELYDTFQAGFYTGRWTISKEEARKRTTEALKFVKAKKEKTIPTITIINANSEMADSNITNLTLYSFNSKLSFGRHKGEVIWEMFTQNNFKYILWCVVNLKHFVLDKLAMLDIINTGLVQENLMNAIAKVNENKMQQLIKQMKSGSNRTDSHHDEWEGILGNEDNYCPNCQMAPCHCSDPDPG